MVELAEIQATYYMVAATGVLVAALYYIYNIRTTQRNMKINQETRQIQILLDLNKDINESLSSMQQWLAMRNAEWSSFDEYQTKYGPGVDPEGHSYRLNMWRRMHVMGLMVRDGLINLDTFMEYVGDSPASFWLKYGDLIKEYRIRFQFPTYFSGFEYLADEVNRYRISKGWGEKTPDVVTYPTGEKADG